MHQPSSPRPIRCIFLYGLIDHSLLTTCTDFLIFKLCYCGNNVTSMYTALKWTLRCSKSVLCIVRHQMSASNSSSTTSQLNQRSINTSNIKAFTRSQQKPLIDHQREANKANKVNNIGSSETSSEHLHRLHPPASEVLIPGCGCVASGNGDTPQQV